MPDRKPDLVRCACEHCTCAELVDGNQVTVCARCAREHNEPTEPGGAGDD